MRLPTLQVMHHFFTEHFADPVEWMERRTTYTRSVAANSMVGGGCGASVPGDDFVARHPQCLRAWGASVPEYLGLCVLGYLEAQGGICA